MKTVLIYVLSSHNPPYEQMIQTSMETWDLEPLEGTTTLYYCGRPISINTNRILSFDVEEDYRTIGRKDIMAFDSALYHPWDFMARVNASCYVHKRRLLDHVQTLPDRGLIRGVTSEPTPVCGVNRRFMWGGGQFIISRDVIQAFVDNRDKWRHDLIEDVAMGELAQDLGFAIDSNGMFASISFDAAGKRQFIAYNGPEEAQFFFRVKHDADRRVDADLMRELKATLPP